MPSVRARVPARGPAFRMLIVLLLAALSILTTPAEAGTTLSLAAVHAASSSSPSPARVDALIGQIQDPTARAKLVQELKLLVKAQQAQAPSPTRTADATMATLTRIGDHVARLSNQLVTAATALEDLPGIEHWLRQQLQQPERRALWRQVLGNLALTIGLGYAAMLLARLVLRRPRRRLAGRRPSRDWLRLPLLASIAVLDLVAIAVFAGGAYAMLTWLDPRDQTRVVAVAWINAVLLVQAVQLLARALFAPTAPAVRLLPLNDTDARRGVRWSGIIARTGIYGFFAIRAAGLLGLSDGGREALFRLLGLVLLLLAMALIIRLRRPIAHRIRGGGEAFGAGEDHALRELRRHLAGLWHIPVLLYLATIYGIWALEVIDGADRLLWGTLLTVVFIAVATAVSRLGDRGIRAALSPDQDPRPLRRGLRRRLRRWQPALRLTFRWLVWGLALFAILAAWGLPSFAWLTAGAGRTIALTLASLLLTLLLALAVWEGANLAIAGFLAEHDEEAGKPPLRSARTRTLLTVARTALMVLLSVVTVLVVLSELGIDIRPMLAAAGVLGVAVGFGSQKLIQDVITGFFILLEDVFAVGDVIQVGDTAGAVEAVSIRNVRLRDLSGTVHTIPFSTIDRISNLTRDFSCYVFDIGIAYREDVDQVIGVLQEIGAAMRADPYFGPLIIDDLEVFGLDAFGDSAIMIKGRIKTLPIKQWETGREFNRRVKERFDQLDIEIPFPHRTLYFGTAKDGSAPAAHIEQIMREPPAPEPPMLTARTAEAGAG